MRILFLCKRRPQGRDLIEQPYGRFFHIPTLMAASGFDIKVCLLSYARNEPEQQLHRDGLCWTSHPPSNYYRHVRTLCRQWQPDWIIGLSDTWYGILAQHLANSSGSRYAIDAYDNYEGYIPWLLPLHWRWRHALAHSHLTIATGPALADLINRQRPGKPAIVVPMATDPIGFRPLERFQCRNKLDIKLPQGHRLLGYCGSIHANRGIQQLFTAVTQIPRTTLLLSGRPDPSIKLPPGTIHLGYIPDDSMPLLYNSLDALASINRNSKFGNYSHPIKLYEAMSCEIPVIASETPTTRWILKDHPKLLTPPDSPDHLKKTLSRTLQEDRIKYTPQPSWSDNCETIIEEIHRITTDRK